MLFVTIMLAQAAVADIPPAAPGPDVFSFYEQTGTLDDWLAVLGGFNQTHIGLVHWHACLGSHAGKTSGDASEDYRQVRDAIEECAEHEVGIVQGLQSQALERGDDRDVSYGKVRRITDQMREWAKLSLLTALDWQRRHR